MKKTILTFSLICIITLCLTGCGNKLGGDEPLSNKKDLILTIEKGNKSCIPVKLAVYEDGTYELFTAYEACKPGETCSLMLKYTKSVKGETDYNVLKIIEDENVEQDKSHDMDNLPEYEIYLSNNYVEKGYGYYYTIEKNQTNKYLNELLESLEIDLKVCANPEYIK